MPPCEEKCVDFSKNGKNYDGKVSTDYRGRDCVAWKDTTVGRKFKDAYAQSSNYCRNRHKTAPWVFCYVDKDFKTVKYFQELLTYRKFLILDKILLVYTKSLSAMFRYVNRHQTVLFSL